MTRAGAKRTRSADSHAACDALTAAGQFVFITGRDRRLAASICRRPRFTVVERTIAQNTQACSLCGGVPERPKGSDCKSDGSAFGGSNPPPSTRYDDSWTGRIRGPVGPNLRPRVRVQCGCSSMVEPQPSKLMTWVRFPSPAPLMATVVCRARAVAACAPHLIGRARSR